MPPNTQNNPSGAIPVWITGVPGGPLAAIANSYQRKGITTAAVIDLTPIPAGCVQVLVTVEGANVRWTDDTSNPTTGALGTPLLATQSQMFAGAAEIAALKFIADSNGGFLNIAYYK